MVVTLSYLVFITGLPQYTYGLDLAHGVRIIVPASVYIYIYICLFIYLYLLIYDYVFTACEAVDF